MPISFHRDQAPAVVVPQYNQDWEMVNGKATAEGDEALLVAQRVAEWTRTLFPKNTEKMAAAVVGCEVRTMRGYISTTSPQRASGPIFDRMVKVYGWKFLAFVYQDLIDVPPDWQQVRADFLASARALEEAER